MGALYSSTGFAVLPWPLMDTAPSPLVLAVYAWLHRHGFGSEEGCWAGVMNLSERSKVGHNTVRSAIAWLREHGWVEAHERPGFTTVYRVRTDCPATAFIATPPESGRPPQSSRATPPGSRRPTKSGRATPPESGRGPLPNSVDEQETPNKNKKKSKSPPGIPPSSDLSSQRSPRTPAAPPATELQPADQSPRQPAEPGLTGSPPPEKPEVAPPAPAAAAVSPAPVPQQQPPALAAVGQEPPPMAAAALEPQLAHPAPAEAPPLVLVPPPSDPVPTPPPAVTKPPAARKRFSPGPADVPVDLQPLAEDLIEFWAASTGARTPGAWARMLNEVRRVVQHEEGGIEVVRAQLGKGIQVGWKSFTFDRWEEYRKPRANGQLRRTDTPATGLEHLHGARPTRSEVGRLNFLRSMAQG